MVSHDHVTSAPPLSDGTSESSPQTPIYHRIHHSVKVIVESYKSDHFQVFRLTVKRILSYTKDAYLQC